MDELPLQSQTPTLVAIFAAGRAIIAGIRAGIAAVLASGNAYTPLALAGMTEAGLANTLHHIFDFEEHQLGGFLQQFGGNGELAYDAIRQATLGAAMAQNWGEGVFEKTVQVGSQVMTVTGNIINATLYVSNAWIP